LLLNDQGGILDDLMFVNRGDDIFVVVNGACKVADIAHIQARIGNRCEVIPSPDLALLALQGPQAVDALSDLVTGVEKLVFMSGQSFDWQGVSLFITRSGYTGEDGFEISVANAHATDLANALLEHSAVQSIGLGARNSLRLEAGLCLYGQDIDTSTTPVEAGLNWAIQKVRRTGGARAGGFPGADKVLAQLDAPQTLTQQRVGLIAQERVPVREHVEINNASGERIGEVTSGLLAPTVEQPIAMAYLPPAEAVMGHTVFASVRGKVVPMVVSPMPFHPTRYYRG